MSSAVAPRMDSIAGVAMKAGRHRRRRDVSRAGLPLEERTDEIGEALEDIDAHGAPAEETEAGQPIEILSIAGR